MLPTIPRDEVVCNTLFFNIFEMPIDAPNAPSIAVGWNPCLCIAIGDTKASLHINSEPTAKPFKISFGFNL